MASISANRRRNAPKKDGGILEGKTLVVTGTLTRFTREEINELIQEHGGKAAGSVSKKTDYRRRGRKRGQQARQGREIGVTVITEDEFMKLIGAE